LVRVRDVVPVPWRNGGGRTRELLVGPGAEWRWRISVADVEADGPFSAFPGVERWFAVLEGEGVALELGDRVAVVRTGELLCFDGAAAPMCRLLAGPTRDLNLMLRDAAGELCGARSGGAWAVDWPLRGHFDRASATLSWGLPPGPLHAPGDGFWIGVRP
jgi:environmental stress-induced protein Ves